MTRTRHALIAAVVASTTLGGPTSAAASPPTTPAARHATGVATAPAAPATRAVTLITGDVVHLTTLADGRHSVTVDSDVPGASRFAFSEQGGHVEVVPVEAMPYLAHGQLDRALFDVTGLVAQGYDDASSDTLPLMLSTLPPTGSVRPGARLPAIPDGARHGVELPSVGAVPTPWNRTSASGSATGWSPTGGSPSTWSASR